MKILIVTVSISISYIREEMRQALKSLEINGHIVDWLVLTEQLEDSELYTGSQWTVGKTLAHNQNKARLFALENGYDYLFLLESDVIPPPKALLWLLENEADIVSGVVAERLSKIAELKSGEPNLQIYTQGYAGVKQLVRAGKPFILEQANTGRACLLISKKALEYPFYESDGWWCSKMREYGFKIIVDPRVACSHVDRDGSIMKPIP